MRKVYIFAEFMPFMVHRYGLTDRSVKVPRSLGFHSLGTEHVLKFVFFILKHSKTFISPSAVFSEKVAIGSVLGNPELKPGFGFSETEPNPRSGFPRMESKSGSRFPGTEPETDTPYSRMSWKD